MQLTPPRRLALPASRLPVISAVAALMLGWVLSGSSPWAGQTLVMVVGVIVVIWLSAVTTRDRAAVWIVAASLVCRLILAIVLLVAASAEWPVVSSLRSEAGYWTFALDASAYEQHVRQLLAGDWTDGYWINELTGEAYRLGRLEAPRPDLIRVPGEGPAVPPDGRSGWRWTSGGEWVNDVTRERYRDGELIPLPAPVPGSGPSVPPDEQPGWRWTSDGQWVNDLTGGVFRGGAVVQATVAAPPPGSGPEVPPDERPDWRWTSDGEWVNDVTGEIFVYQPPPPPATSSGQEELSIAPPDQRPGWRWTSEGQWVNDLTGEFFRDGEVIAPPPVAAPAPGSGPDAAPDARPGWRWTGEGQWVNDLTGEYYRDGEVLAPPPVAAPTPGSGPDAPPNEQPGWRWTSDGRWLNDLTGELFVSEESPETPSMPTQAPSSGQRAPSIDGGSAARPGDAASLADCAAAACLLTVPVNGFSRLIVSAPEPSPGTPEMYVSSPAELVRGLASVQTVPRSEPDEMRAIVRPPVGDPGQQILTGLGPASPPDDRPGWRWVTGSPLPHPTRWFALPVAIVEAIYGHTPLTPMGLNALYAALATLLAYSIVRIWGDRNAARLACLLVGFWPSWVIWSAVFLKESLILLVLLCSVRLSIALARTWRSWRPRNWWRTAGLSIAFAATVAYLHELREVIAWGWLLAIAVAPVGTVADALQQRRYKLVALLVAVPTIGLALILIAVSLPKLGRNCVDCHLLSTESSSALVRVIAERRQGSLSTRGGLTVGADRAVTSLPDVLGLLPLSVGNTLLAPYPNSWLQLGQTTGAFRVFAAFEAVILYALLLPLLWGTWQTVRRRAPAALPTAVLALSLTVIMGLVVVNEGTLFRIRDAPLVLLLLLGIAGWDLALWRQRLSRVLVSLYLRRVPVGGQG